jgi:hypothetical protein
MPYTVKHDPALDIIGVKLTGVLTPEDLSAVTSEAIGLQRQTGSTRFLVDVNEWVARDSLATIYKLASSQYLKEQVQRTSRIGVILPASVSAREATQFYETVCYNYGWNARVCPDRQEAIDWLTGL